MAYNKKSPQKMNPIKKYKLRRSKLQRQIKCKIEKYKLSESDIPSPPHFITMLSMINYEFYNYSF